MLGRIRKVAGKMSSDKETIRGEVEADETFLGGKEKNKHAGKRTHSGGGIKGKQVVAGLWSRKGEVRLMQAEDTSKATLQSFVYRNVAADATVYIDEHRFYMGLVGPFKRVWWVSTLCYISLDFFANLLNGSH